MASGWRCSSSRAFPCSSRVPCVVLMLSCPPDASQDDGLIPVGDSEVHMSPPRRTRVNFLFRRLTPSLPENLFRRLTSPPAATATSGFNAHMHRLDRRLQV